MRACELLVLQEREDSRIETAAGAGWGLRLVVERVLRERQACSDGAPGSEFFRQRGLLSLKKKERKG